MLGSIIIEPNLWPDAAVIEWWNILLRMHDVPDRARRLAEAGQIMRSRLNWQGTGAHLSGGQCWCLMTDTESNMVRLDLLLVDNNLWHDDVPRVMHGAIETAIAGRVDDDARQRVGHAGGREIRARLRIGAGQGNDHGVARGGRAKTQLGPRSQRRQPESGVAASASRSARRSQRQRKSVGPDSLARGDPPKVAVFQRLPDHANAERRGHEP